jgi:outer membrane protein assembly factor BamB
LPTIKAAEVAKLSEYDHFASSAIKQLMDRGQVVMHSQWSHPAHAVANGKPQVIFPGGDGWLYSFEPRTGNLIWKFDANPKNAKYELGGRGTRSDFVMAAPVVVGNRLYIGTGQDPEHYEGVGQLWCIDITRTGDVSRQLVVDSSLWPPKTTQNPNSAVIWHYGGPGPPGPGMPARGYYFGRTMSTVAVHDGLVYAAELAGYLHCLDAHTGKLYWGADLAAAIWGAPYWVDNKVYVATEDGDVWIFPHGKTKPQGKRIEMGYPIRGTPVAAGGVLYIMTESHLYAIAQQ